MSASISHLENGKVEISTQRLHLRAATENDIEPLFEVFGDAEVMRYWSTPPHAVIETTETGVGKLIEGESNGVTEFVICLQHDPRPIGKIGVWQDEEVGFLLGRKHWGKGYALEAFNALLPFYFNEKHLRCITADTDPRNDASIGLLKKLGFVVYSFKEKTWQVGDEWVDSLYLKLTKEDWQARQASG